jgi:CHAT domain-containing protein/tetratricopeptide (TPR) repeat protein
VLEAEVAALVSLADVHLSRGNLTAAQEVSTEALGKAARSADKGLAAAIYSNLGNILRARGEFTKAREQFDQALRGARASKDHKLETTVLSNLADLLLGLGDAVGAERYLRQALAKARAVNDRDSEGTVLNNLSAAARDRGDIEAAYELQLASFQIRKEIGNPYHEAHNLLSLGGFSWDLGRADEAKQSWMRALDIGRTLKSQGLTCAALNNLATSAEDWKEGLSYTQEALALLAGRPLRSSDSDPYPNPEKPLLLDHDANARMLLANKGQILILAAKNARADGNDEKEKSLLHQAGRSLALAVELTEDVRTSIDETEHRISFLKSGMGPYEALVEVSLRLDVLEKGAGWAAKAFRYSERSKSRALAELLRESQAKKLAGIPDNELKQEKELELQIGAVQAEIAKEQFPEGRERLQNQLAQRAESFRKFREGLKLKYPRYAALNRADVTSAEDLQKTLDGDTVLLEYFTGHDFIACWAITRNDVRSFVVPKSARISDKIEDYQSALLNPIVSFTPFRPEPTEGRPDEEPLAVGQQLFERLVAPALEGTGAAKRLAIIPDGLLSRLPFEALVIGTREDRPRYLVDRFAVSYAPSATVFAAVKASATNKTFPETLFAMGRPAYRGKNRPPDSGRARPEELLRLAKRGSIEEPLARLRQAVGLEGITLEDLPGTGREVDDIGQILRSSEFIFKREQATERRVKEFSRRGKLKEFQYLHFAAHGLVPDMAPGLASIALAQDEDPAEDGFLTVGEIYGLELGCDLVTVSACKVGLGQMVRGEGVVGLTRAFLYAGARSVAVTLWSISDDATPLLMKHFYINLNQGMTRDEALRQAKLSLMHESFTDRSGQTVNLNHPFYWAPFVICGNAQ